MKKEYQEKIFFNIGSKESFGFDRYWLHKYQVIMQFNRLQTAFHERSLSTELIKTPNIDNQTEVKLWFHFGTIVNNKVLAEIHLLFISLDNLKDMINVILSNDTLKHLKRDIGSFYKELEHYTHGRNTFEHFDEKLPGGKTHSKVKGIRENINCGERKILGGLKGNIYLFGDKEWELSNIKFQKIIDGMDVFENSLLNYLDEKYDV